MKRGTVLSTVCAAALLATGSAFAQAPAGGMPSTQTPTQSPTQSPTQTPPTMPQRQSPDMQRQGPDTMDTGTNAARTKVDDKKFLKDAALGGMTEVELGKLAAQKASDDKIKQLGQKMVDDHTKANEQLKQVASRDNIQVPDSLDSKHQSRIEKLSKLSGEQFDKAYLKDEVKDHQTDVRDFTDEAQNGTDPNVKSFASATLPTLQQHLELVKSLAKSEKGTGKGQ